MSSSVKGQKRALRLGLSDSLENFEPLSEREFIKWWLQHEGGTPNQAKLLWKTYLFGYGAKRYQKNPSYSTDKAFREEAQKVWKKLLAYVKTDAKKGYPKITYAQIGSEGRLYLPPESRKKIGIPEDLIIGFGTYEEDSQLESDGIKRYLIIGEMLHKPFDPTELEFNLHSVDAQASFIHEYIHYLDYHRGTDKNLKELWQAHKAAQEGKLSKYIQTASEYNAWFQHTSFIIEHQVKSELDSIQFMHELGGDQAKEAEEKLYDLKDIFFTFNDFLDWVEESDSEYLSIVEALSRAKWKKKWQRRMYTLYEELKQQVDSFEL